MSAEEKNHNWTIHGPDPEGVEVPGYIAMARNHLATREIPLKDVTSTRPEISTYTSLDLLLASVIMSPFLKYTFEDIFDIS